MLWTAPWSRWWRCRWAPWGRSQSSTENATVRIARPTGIELVDNGEAEEHEELQGTKRACGHNGNINFVKSSKTKRTQRGNSKLDQDQQNCKDEDWNKAPQSTSAHQDPRPLPGRQVLGQLRNEEWGDCHGL